MSETPLLKEAKARKGVAGAAFFVFAIIGAAALGADIALGGANRFWIGAEPGARAAIGAGVALIAALGAHGARLLLARRDTDGPADA